ncbi:MAG: chemotaxis protein CheW [Candidatus Solibacter sp.]|jgi:purine-binding chemotaxis protein CheW
MQEPASVSCQTLWVIIEIRKQEFAVPATFVREIVAMPDVTAVPQCSPQHRGVINLRGRLLSLTDLRKQFGWQSIQEELEGFYSLMGQREQDHRNWLRELERSVADGSEFRLARDPHKCAFGRWYDSYRSESPWIMALLRKFEPPHGKIHALAFSIDELVKSGKNEEALRLIESARHGVLQEMILLFQQLRQLMRENVKELALVITVAQRTFAVSIDQALAVEKIAPDLIQEVQPDVISPGCGLVYRTVQRRSGTLAMILEPDRLLCGRRQAEREPVTPAN